MTKVSIDLDLEVIQQAIKAHTVDAVHAVLVRYDLQRMVEEAITSTKRPEPIAEGWPIFSPRLSPREMFEQMLHKAIGLALQDACAQYLRDNPRLIEAHVQERLPGAIARLSVKLTSEEDDE